MKPQTERSSLIVCSHCDLLVEVGIIKPGLKASCPRCGHTLFKSSNNDFPTQFSLIFTAIFLFMLAHAYPFMSFSRSGHEQTVTLFEFSVQAYHHDSVFLAILVFLFVIAIPAIYLLISLGIVIPLAFHHHHPSFQSLMKIAFGMKEWIMLDVFILGILVSLTKIASLATIEFGISFLAFVAFTATLSLIVSNLNKERLWEQWEKLKHS